MAGETVSLSSNSTTVILNATAIDNLVDGDTITITPANPATEQTTGSGAVNIQERADKDIHDVVLKVVKYSNSDTILNGFRNASPLQVIQGSIKETYIKDGTELTTTYTCEQGSITVQPTETRNNQTGNNSMEYTIRFNSAVRL